MNKYLYSINPLKIIDPYGLMEICEHNYYFASKWEEHFIRENWELVGKKVIHTGVSGTCHWFKFRSGSRERYVTEMFLCWDSCDPSNTYEKSGETQYQSVSFKYRIDSDVTPIWWVFSVETGWVSACERDYRFPLTKYPK